MPDIAVPIGRYEPGNIGPGPCILTGAYFPFDEARLDELYRSHGQYVAAVRHAAGALLEDGHLLREDAAEYGRRAARSRIGK